MSKLYVNEIQSKTSGGVITNNSQCGFSAGAGALQTISSGAYTKCTQLSTSHALGFDTYSGWSNSDDYYTIPTGCGGYWLLTGQIQWTRSANLMMVVITTNGDDATDTDGFLTRNLNGESGDTSNDVTVQTTGVFNLSEGDKIALVAYHNYGSDVDISFNTVHLRTSLTGWRLM